MRAALAAGLGLVLSACGGLGGTDVPVDDGRETVVIQTPADSVRYLVYPAILDGVFVRPAKAAVAPGEAVAVEVLVKGTLPDACSELNAASQSRAGHFVEVELTQRTPRGPVCAQVVRPFRFYLLLDDAFEAGHYTLTLNGTAHPFRIRVAGEDDGLPTVDEDARPASERLPVE